MRVVVLPASVTESCADKVVQPSYAMISIHTTLTRCQNATHIPACRPDARSSTLLAFDEFGEIEQGYSLMIVVAVICTIAHRYVYAHESSN